MICEDDLRRAADAIALADALIIGAGAGMGVDSGLPDFRGTQGFWKAYPPYAKLGMSFSQMANPQWFISDPALAWGFYGHRLNLYRSTVPHRGFELLRNWAGRMKHGSFVFTSNVDGQFQRAGFDEERIVECHGSIHWMQCMQCGVDIYPAGEVKIEVDESTMRAHEPLPACPSCGSHARPNILMFGDWGWKDSRTSEQMELLEGWIGTAVENQNVIIEMGAGTGVPSVRRFSEQIAGSANCKLIRINPREPEVSGNHISLPLGALQALEEIDRLLTVP